MPRINKVQKKTPVITSDESSDEEPKIIDESSDEEEDEEPKIIDESSDEDEDEDEEDVVDVKVIDNTSDSEEDEEDSKKEEVKPKKNKTKTEKKPRKKAMAPSEQIDSIIGQLEEAGQMTKVIAQLQTLKKQLEGTKIKQTTVKREPTPYNLWMKEKMAELKDNGMTPRERFSECIRLWNESKKKN